MTCPVVKQPQRNNQCEIRATDQSRVMFGRPRQGFLRVQQVVAADIRRRLQRHAQMRNLQIILLCRANYNLS